MPLGPFDHPLLVTGPKREFQALSSEGPAGHTQAAPRAVASSGQTDVVQAAK